MKEITPEMLEHFKYTILGRERKTKEALKMCLNDLGINDSFVVLVYRADRDVYEVL